MYHFEYNTNNNIRTNKNTYTTAATTVVTVPPNAMYHFEYNTNNNIRTNKNTYTTAATVTVPPKRGDVTNISPGTNPGSP